MSRRIWILNLGLIALLLFVVVKFRQDWRAFGPLHDVQSIRPAPTVLPSLPAPAKSAAATESAWKDIPTHDPFSFDRNDVAIVIAPTVPKPLGPKPILFGTLILGAADRTALVASGSTANRNSRPMRIGESIDGWTLTDISYKKIQIEADGVSQSVTVDDSSAQIPRDYSRTAVNAAPPVQAIPSPAVPAGIANPAAPLVPGQKGTHTEMSPFGTLRVVKDPL